jgi:hypothetical protein
MSNDKRFLATAAFGEVEMELGVSELDGYASVGFPRF